MNNGYIESGELVTVLRACGYNGTDAKVEEILSKSDVGE